MDIDKLFAPKQYGVRALISSFWGRNKASFQFIHIKYCFFKTKQNSLHHKPMATVPSNVIRIQQLTRQQLSSTKYIYTGSCSLFVCHRKSDRHFANTGQYAEIMVNENTFSVTLPKDSASIHILFIFHFSSKYKQNLKMHIKLNKLKDLIIEN